jgi:hypothetical protein
VRFFTSQVRRRSGLAPANQSLERLLRDAAVRGRD